MARPTFSDRFLRRKPARRIASRRRRPFRLEQLEKRNLLATYVVNSLSDDVNDAADLNGRVTLRQALLAASFDNSRPSRLPSGEEVDIIRFADSLFTDGAKTITLKPEQHLDLISSRVPAGALFVDGSFDNADPFIADGGSVSIVGPGPDLLTIDAGGADNIFITEDVVNISGIRLTGSQQRAIRARVAPPSNYSGTVYESVNTTIDDVRIDGNRGGGIVHTQGVLTVRNSIIADNGFVGETVQQASGGGIDIAITGGRNVPSVIIEDSVIRGNQAFQGGGIANNGGQLVISRSTIEDNIAVASPTNDSSGGGIYLGSFDHQPASVAVSIDGSVIANNTADIGGGIFVANSSVIVRESLIDSNRALKSGGGVAVLEQSGLFRDPFSTDMVLLGQDSRFTLSGSTVSSNVAPIGGGIDNLGGTVSVTESTFNDNEATKDGGAIAARRTIEGVFGTNGPRTVLSNTTISGNLAADSGGGIFYDPITIGVDDDPRYSDNQKNELRSNDRLKSSLAGLNSYLRLINDTIVLNQADANADFVGSGGGLAVNEVVGSPATRLINTIVAGNTIRDIDAVQLVAPSDLGLLSSQPIRVNESRYNLISDPNTAGGLIDVGVVGVAPELNNHVGDAIGNPLDIDRILFRDLADNLGGQPQAPLFGTGRQIQRPAVHALKINSPALDAGTPFLPSATEGIHFDPSGTPIFLFGAPYPDALQSDQRGLPFLRVDESVRDAGQFERPVDIGAYESQLRPIFTSNELVVSTLGDDEDGDYSYGNLSLREAISIANRSPDRNGIRFAPSLIETESGVTSTIVLTSPLQINFDLTLSGPGSDLMQISGNDQTRMLEIGPLATVTISGLSLVDGYGARSTSLFDTISMTAGGGALYNAGDATLSDVNFHDNRSVDDGVNLVNSVLFLSSGGGAILNTGTMSISNSVVSNNQSDTDGGGIANVLPETGRLRNSSLQIGPNVEIKNNNAGSLAGNAGGGEHRGGGIYSETPLTIIDSTVQGNVARGEGGGAYSGPNQTGFSSSLTVQRSTFTLNTSNGGGGGAIRSLAELSVFDTSVVTNAAVNEQGDTAIGGGIYATAQDANSVLIERSTVSDNIVDSVKSLGGGIAIDLLRSVRGFAKPGESFTILSSTIAENTAKGGANALGGGVFVFGGGVPVIRDSTIALNHLEGLLHHGPGIFLDGPASMGNTIVAANTSAASSNATISVGEQVYIYAAPEPSLQITNNAPFLSSINDGYQGELRLTEASIIPSFNGSQSGIAGASSGVNTTLVLNDDPNLSPQLRDNGGRTQTIAVGANSNAIDNGIRQGLLDQRGFPVTDQAASIFDAAGADNEFGDIGAYESSQIRTAKFTSEIRDASQFGTGDALVFGQGFDDGRPNSNIPKAPGFLGIEFDKTFSVGPGIATDPLFGTKWGADAKADVDGRIGIEYGYYVNSGSVDTFYDGVFAYSINKTSDTEYVIGTGTELTGGSLYTVSPRISAYADLVFSFNATLSGTGCVVACASGTLPIGVNEKIPLFSINRQLEDANGNKQFSKPDGGLTTDSEGGKNPAAFDGNIVIAGLNLSSLLAYDFDDDESQTDEVAKAREAKRKAEIAKAQGKPGDHDAEIRKAIDDEKKATQKKSGDETGGGAGLSVSFGQAEDLLGVKADVSVGGSVKVGGVKVGVEKPLGSLSLTVPDVQLTDHEFDNAQHRLSATTDDFARGSDLDAKRNIASLSVDVGAIGPLGTYNLSAGPIDVSATTVSYVITPRLAVKQSVSVEPYFDATHQAAFDFTFDGGGTIDVYAGANGSPQAIASGGSISFMPGTEIRVNSNGKTNVHVTPSVNLGNRFSNDIGLDLDVQGLLEILKLKLSAFGTDLIDLGPLYRESQTLLDNFDIGSIFASTFDLPSTRTELAGFDLDSPDPGSERDGKTPGGAFLLTSGTPTQIDPVDNQTTYFTVPLIGPDGVVHTDVKFQTQGNDTVLIRPPYAGLTLELLDGNGNVQSAYVVDVGGSTFQPGNGPQSWRLRGFEDLLGSEATFGVKFSNGAERHVTVTAEGGAPLTQKGDHVSQLLTAAKQAEFEAKANLFVRDNDFTLDIDGDGKLLPTTDGTLIARYMAGKTDSALIDGITSTDVVSSTATRTTASEILAYLQGLESKGRLDVDDNDAVEASVDGVLILRHFSGIGATSTTQAALTAGLVFSPSSQRTLPADIRAFIDGGTSPALNQTYADDVLSFSDRPDLPQFPVASDAVIGSSPYAPLQAAFDRAIGVYDLATFGDLVPFEDLYLVDEDDANVRTLVRSSAAGTPGRRIDVPTELQRFLSDPLSPEIDVLTERIQRVTRTQSLGVEEPIFVRIPAAAGYEFNVPTGLAVTQLQFDAGAGGNALLDHTVANSGTDIDFDLFIPATSQWFEISMSTPFTLPAGTTQFELYPRPLVSLQALDPVNQTKPDLDLNVGLVLSGPATPVPNLTVKILADQQSTVNLDEILIGADQTAPYQTRIARDGAYLSVSTNGVPAILSTQDHPSQTTGTHAYTYASLDSSRYAVADDPSRTPALVITGIPNTSDTLTLDGRGGPLYQSFRFDAEPGQLAPASGWSDGIDVQGQGVVVDLRSSAIHGVQRIDMRGSGANSLTVTPKSLYDNASEGKPLIVIAGADDTVTLSEAASWTKLPTQVTDPVSGLMFDVFENSFEQGSDPVLSYPVVLWVSVAGNTPAAPAPPAVPDFPFPASTLTKAVDNPIQAPGQVVMIPPSDTDLTLGEKFTIDVQYNIDASTTVPPALLLEIHYDSTRVAFSGVPFLLGAGLVNGANANNAEFEVVSDNDLRTDTTIILSWNSFLGAWPADSTTPEKLATIEFQGLDVSGVSDIRVTGVSSNGFLLDADHSVRVTLEGNLPPTFTAVAPPAVHEDSGPQSFELVTTSDAIELGQSIKGFSVSQLSRRSLFAVPPMIDANGLLTYTPAPNASGASSFVVVALDDAGGLGSGSGTSAPQTFTIHVTPRNDAPSFTAIDPPVVDSDNGQQTVVGWASNFVPGPADEASQSIRAYVVSTVDTDMFDVLPAVDVAGNLTYTPKPNVVGRARFTVSAQDDGGTANGGTDTSVPIAYGITLIDPPNITVQPENAVGVFNHEGSLTVTATGNDPLQYQWIIHEDKAVDGYLLGADKRTLTFPQLLENETGDYQVIVTDSGGSTISDSVSLGAQLDFQNNPFHFIYDSTNSVGFNDPVEGDGYKQDLETAAAYVQRLLFNFLPAGVKVDVLVRSLEGMIPKVEIDSEYEISGPGFIRSVASEKLASGNDLNGSAIDVTLDVTFPSSASPFTFEWSVDELQSNPDTAIDTVSFLLHELTHLFGFDSNIQQDGTSRVSSESDDGRGRVWTEFDRHLGDKDGHLLIDPVSFELNQAMWDRISTGGRDANGGGTPDGGLYFHGAIASGPSSLGGYNGPIPIYSPPIWVEGESGRHLALSDTDSLMTAGLLTGLRPLEHSKVEKAILRDTGYKVDESNLPTFTSIPATYEATGPSGISVSALTASATDDSDPNPIVTAIAAGASFLFPDHTLPLGKTRVLFQAIDYFGNVRFAEQEISVVDTTAPSLLLERDTVVLDAGQSLSNALAMINPQATDLVDEFPTIVNDAPAVLPNGMTTIVFTATDRSGNVSTATATVSTAKETPVVTWANPGDIVAGTALGASQLNASANVPGNFVYTPAIGAILSAGASRSLSVTFTPTDTVTYESVTASVTLNVLNQKDPDIAWPMPADIVFGSALSMAQLNATSTALGTFVYTPALDTALNAGNGQTLSVTFTPDDTTRFNTITKTTSINVLKADPVVAWTDPTAIFAGVALGTDELNATANIPGSFVYLPASGTVLTAGTSQSLSTTFTPTDTSNYNTVTTSVTINVLALSLDFGDAPSQTQSGFDSNYPVTKNQDGASHVVGSLFLGAAVEAEIDGTASQDAAGDTDDDGIFFLTNPVVGTSTTSSVRVHSSGTGIVDAWLDFNRDGDWNDLGEKIISGAIVNAGDTLISYPVPAGALAGSSYARFRLSTLGSDLPTGPAEDGEVEDSQVDLLSGTASPTVTLRSVTSDNMLSLGPDFVRLISGTLTQFEAPNDQVGTIDYQPLTTPEAINVVLSADYAVTADQIQFRAFADGSSVNLSGAGGSIDLTNVATQAAQGRVTLDLTHGDTSSATIDAGLAQKWSSDTLPMQVMIGANDHLLFTHAEEWRMTDPVGMGSTFQLTAATQSGDAAIIVSAAQPWQNFIRLNDVNVDGFVTALDALRVINELNEPKFSDSDGRLFDRASLTENPRSYYDTNGDGLVTALDALRVINELNTQPAGGEPIENASQGWSLAAKVTPLAVARHIRTSNGESVPTREELRVSPRSDNPSVMSTDLVMRQRAPADRRSFSADENSLADKDLHAVDELFAKEAFADIRVL
ncbi:choice-of-anchor Q domain-containing protein [Allorhodopirellula heiligendammensis]|uniref:Dockerin type I repeat protein n=1 Tax=Allorhodopirellula heiligendammensis TaxID=2714739 RepID=A0A5C6C086_9BACT|nr:choice-of-anchor Q domain-containing protein [Allorhodopirellula heiligendammensis]TWU17051.1 Dockerin type I repeat protein [Allorhodopirellula heiligendammensis]